MNESSPMAWAYLGRCQTSWLVRRADTDAYAWLIKEESNANLVRGEPMRHVQYLIDRALAVFELILHRISCENGVICDQGTAESCRPLFGANGREDLQLKRACLVRIPREISPATQRLCAETLETNIDSLEAGS